MIALFTALVALQQQRPIESELYRAQIAAAESAIRLDELAVARTWLDETDPALRGFEWKAHDAELDESLASLPTGDTHAYLIDTSPNGELLALGRTDGAIELRKATDGTVLGELGRHAESVSYVRFSADSARLVSASFDRTVKVWDVAARKLVVDFTQHGSPVGGAAFSPAGALVASCSYERSAERGVYGVLHVWNAADGSLVRTLEGGRKPLIGLAFSPDGKRVAAGSWDFCVFVWRVDGGEPVKCAVPDEGIYNAVDDVVWTADGAHVIGASKDKTARVWKADSGELVATLRGHTDAVSKLALSPDGAWLASAGADGVAKLWSTADWTLRASLRGHGDDVTSCAFASDGKRLFTSSSDRTLRIWSADPMDYGGQRFEATRAPYVACFSPDDSRIATASYDGRIEVRDAKTNSVVRSWRAHPEDKSCHALAWTADGARLVSGSWEPVVRVWSVSDGAEVASFEQESGTCYLATSRDGARAAVCNGKRVTVYDFAASAKLHEFQGHGATVLAVNFSPDSSRCVSGARDGKAIVWSAATGAAEFEVRCADADVAEAMFTPDGAQLVVAGSGGSITLHDARDGALVRPLANLRHGLNHIDISPDGARLAVASNVVALIDVQVGGVVGELRRHVEHPYNVDFDARGVRLISCSTDKTVVVTDTRPLRMRLAHR